MVCCAALNCQNATSGVYKNSSVSFYSFPLQNKALLRQWIQNMGRDMDTPSKYQRLCSAHFEESSFESRPFKVRKNRRLLKEAVPRKFILGEDGKWLVGTPQGFCSVVRSNSRKRIRNPESCGSPGMFPQGPRLEDWQNEFCKQLLKEKYGSVIALGKGCSVRKTGIPAGRAAKVKDPQDLEGRKTPASLSTGHGGAVIRAKPQGAGGTKRQGASSGASSGASPGTSSGASPGASSGASSGASPGASSGTSSGASRDLHSRSSDRGETSASHHHPAPNPANPTGRGSSSSSSSNALAWGTLDEFKQFLLYHRRLPAEADAPWFICTECGKSFARHAYLLRHQRSHAGQRPHACAECGRRFLEKPALHSHLRTHFRIIRVPQAFPG